MTSTNEKQPENTAKKPYSTPDVLYLAPLEAMAGVCSPGLGKSSPVAPQCTDNLLS